MASYEACCARPAAALGQIAERAAIDPAALIAQAERFRPAVAHEDAERAVPASLLARAKGIHEHMLDRAIT